MPSGGPRKGAGRKPGAISREKRALAEMAKDYAEDALGVLTGIMHNTAEPAAARVSAANAILDRGYGRPSQAMDLTNSDGTMSRPTTIILKGPDDDCGAGDSA